MNKLLIIFCSIIWVNLSFSQELTSAKSQADLLADKYTEQYNLDARQTQKILQVCQRYFRHLNEIAPLKLKDPQLYVRKLQAVYSGLDGSTQLILTEEQKVRYKENFNALRKKRSLKRMELQKQGKSAIEIEEAVWAIRE